MAMIGAAGFRTRRQSHVNLFAALYLVSCLPRRFKDRECQSREYNHSAKDRNNGRALAEKNGPRDDADNGH